MNMGEACRRTAQQPLRGTAKRLIKGTVGLRTALDFSIFLAEAYPRANPRRFSGSGKRLAKASPQLNALSGLCIAQGKVSVGIWPKRSNFSALPQRAAWRNRKMS